MRLQKMNKNMLMKICAVLLLSFIPGILSSHEYIILLLNFVGIYTVASTGLDILLGYSGQNSLGQAGFYAIGAYVSAILSVDAGIPVFFSMFIGASVAALVAIVLAIPASKLVHHFLALTTIAFGEIVVALIITSPGNITRGYQGFTGIPSLKILGIHFNTNHSFFYISLAASVLALILKERVINSRIGRAFIAIREDKVAANGAGINVSKYRVMAFAISGFLSAYAGAMYAHMVRFISPESFVMDTSVMFLTIVLFGGLGTYMGPVVGAVTIIAIREVLQTFGSYQMLVYGLFILIVLMFMPKGIVGLFQLIAKREAKSHASGE